MRLIINASLQQVNLVWSSQCAQCSCSSKLSWESVIAILAIILQGPYTGLGGVGFISYMDPGLQGHITPLPVLTPCHSPASHFYGSEVPGITFLAPLTPFLTHQNISSFYSHFSTKLKTQALSKSLSNGANLSHFKETGNTCIYSSGHSAFHLLLAFQHLGTMSRYDLKT